MVMYVNYRGGEVTSVGLASAVTMQLHNLEIPHQLTSIILLLMHNLNYLDSYCTVIALPTS